MRIMDTASGEAWRHVNSTELLKAAKNSQHFLNSMLNQQRRQERRSRETLLLREEFDSTALAKNSQPQVNLSVKNKEAFRRLPATVIQATEESKENTQRRMTASDSDTPIFREITQIVTMNQQRKVESLKKRKV